MKGVCALSESHEMRATLVIKTDLGIRRRELGGLSRALLGRFYRAATQRCGEDREGVTKEPTGSFRAASGASIEMEEKL